MGDTTAGSSEYAALSGLPQDVAAALPASRLALDL